jgi:uncharacterized protein YndB with AHSA1/START domain
MDKTYNSTSSIEINAPTSVVWRTMTDPTLIKQWFLGTNVETDWQAGSPIVFKGEWQGAAYEDRGIIQTIDPEKVLQYTHWSSRTGKADTPENHEVVKLALTGTQDKTILTVSETNLGSADARDMSVKIWGMVLSNLKKVAEAKLK